MSENPRCFAFCLLASNLLRCFIQSDAQILSFAIPAQIRLLSGAGFRYAGGKGMSLSTQSAANRWPAQIKYIIGNEACERFSYYGMRSILAGYSTGAVL